MRSRMRGIRRAGGLLIGSALLVGLSGISVEAAPKASVAPSRVASGQTVTAATGPSGVGAKSALLVDNATGTVKWSRLATTKRPIGSMTKTMTAVVVLRAGGLSRTLTVKQKYINYAIQHGGSMAYLKAGDKLTVRQLLYGLLLPSGCDAAYMLADVYGPTWQKFVKKMNSTAKTLKMTRTKFANFDGLPWPTATSGYSTAQDMVKLGRYAMKSSAFRAVVRSATYSLPATSTHTVYNWKTTNRLLGSYTGAIGIKTGHTDAAGYCLLFAATRNGKTLVGVVLNSSTTTEMARFTDAAKVLDYGFGVQNAAPPAVPAAPGATSIP